jgi:hypothetical protein
MWLVFIIIAFIGIIAYFRKERHLWVYETPNHRKCSCCGRVEMRFFSLWETFYQGDQYAECGEPE